MLKEIREKKGITQQELAEKINISGGYINLLERGARRPSGELAKEIAKILEPAGKSSFEK